MENRIRDYWKDTPETGQSPAFAPENRIYRSHGDRADSAQSPLFWGKGDPHEKEVLLILRSIEMVGISVERGAGKAHISKDRLRVYRRLQALLASCEALTDARSRETKRILNGILMSERATHEEIVALLDERTLQKLHMDLQQRVLL